MLALLPSAITVDFSFHIAAGRRVAVGVAGVFTLLGVRHPLARPLFPKSSVNQAVLAPWPYPDRLLKVY
jgi:hypothetical protein